MQRSNYYQPDTCIPENTYYIRVKDLDAPTNYKSVKFISYCPHPAEVVVRIDGGTKVIHRVYLLQKNSEQNVE